MNYYEPGGTDLYKFFETKTFGGSDADILLRYQSTPFTPTLKQDMSGLYFCDFYPKRDCDIVDDFSFFCDKHVDIWYVCGGTYYKPEEFNEFVFLCAHYHELRIRIVSKEPFDKIIITYRTYWFNNVEDRRHIVSNYPLKTKFLNYMAGMSYSIIQNT